MGPATFAWLVGEAGDVTGPITDEGNPLLGDGGDDQFPRGAGREECAAIRVDDLGNEMVFPDMEPLLRLLALDGDAWPHDFGQAVDVNGRKVKLPLDLLAHGIGPGFSAEDADPQAQRLEVNPFLPCRFCHIE